jgi:alanine dehydrogenase
VGATATRGGFSVEWGAGKPDGGTGNIGSVGVAVQPWVRVAWGYSAMDSSRGAENSGQIAGRVDLLHRPKREVEVIVRVGIPKEIKNHEYRVAATPAGVYELVTNDHEVVIEAGAGVGSSIPDSEFVAAGAQMLATAEAVWESADMILKVKEPIAAEYDRMREGQVIFTYLHLAASQECTDALVKSGATAIAYETVELTDGSLPLLAPMSEVAGRLAPQVGAHSLMRAHGGRGVLMGGVSGVYAAQVVVLGAGVAGMNSAAIALGMQAEVLLLDKNVARLRQVDAIYQGHMQTVASNSFEIEQAVLDADLVIGAVLVPGTKAPKLISNELVSRMKPGSVLVDIAVDQGGCFEDSRPTTHAEPTYQVHESVFYCVANMPGAVPHTSTYALTNVTLPYAVALANKGWKKALSDDGALALGLNVHNHQVTYAAVAESWSYPLMELAEALA